MAYDFDHIIDRRGTSSLKWDFGEKFAGRADLLPMWVADMDFPAPEEITAALRARVGHGVFGYTLEPESYFQAATEWLNRRHGWKVSREWLIPSPGVVPCLSAAILALTEPGDSVVIQPPVYYPFAQRIMANNRRVAENPLVLTGDRWDMDLDGLAAIAQKSRAGMLVLCSPHNPVCRVWDRRTLERLVEICAARGMVIISDDIHSDLVMPGYKHVPLGSISEEAARISVTLIAPTKTFNLAGLGGSLAIVADAAMRKKLEAVQGAVFAAAANALGLAAAEAAWRHGERWLDELLSYVRESHIFLKGFLGEHLPAVKVFPLEGTYLAWIDMRGLGLTEKEINERLRRAGGLWLDEGTMFGSGGDGFQRLNLACPRSILKDGCQRMARALSR
jgi:cysteine-S-conjugate beta-lyase